jgi:hypothetical protein
MALFTLYHIALFAVYKSGSVRRHAVDWLVSLFVELHVLPEACGQKVRPVKPR